MSSRFVSLAEAAETVTHRLRTAWADAVCIQITQCTNRAIHVQLSPGVTSGAVVLRLGLDARTRWVEEWSAVAARGLPGVTVERRRVVVSQVAEMLPATLTLSGLDAATELLALAGLRPPFDHQRACRVAGEILASSARLTPTVLRAVCQLDDDDVQVALEAVRWLRAHPDVGDWTARSIPIPRMHSKWLLKHGALLRDLVGRDVLDEVRSRLAVVHLTYVDPAYAMTGGRRHDAWTTGDTHELAYEPHTVLVVENRDCRLWFPLTPGTVVVEGGGMAAAALLADIPWPRRAPGVVYWGDIDAAGFAILNHFRSALARTSPDGASGRPVASILMDAAALSRYSHLGVDRDARGRRIPSSSETLPHLTDDETEAYHQIATAGEVALRRIEQERIPIADAADALSLHASHATTAPPWRD